MRLAPGLSGYAVHEVMMLFFVLVLGSIGSDMDDINRMVPILWDFQKPVGRKVDDEDGRKRFRRCCSVARKWRDNTRD